MSHTVTVTRLAGDRWDDVGYTIGGSCDDSCAVLRPCEKDWHRHPKNEWAELDEWSTKRVPVPHRFVEGEWMVESEECALRVAGSLNLVVEEATELGCYEVDVEWDDDWWFSLRRVPIPVPHRFVEGEWMVESEECALRVAGSLNLVVEEATELGCYEVDVEWDDDWWFSLRRVPTSDGSGS